MEEITVITEDFSKGMTPDIRDKRKGYSKLIKNFDILTRPNTLTPYHSQISGASNPTTIQITDFLFYVTDLMHGVGVFTTDNKTVVYKNNSFTSTSWTGLTNGESPTNTYVQGVFVEYHGFAYGLNSNGTVWKCDLAEAVAWNNAVTTFSAQPLNTPPNGIVHSKDDILYMASGNIVASNNNGSWTNPALTLPSKYTVTSLCEYGDYLAIGCNSNVAGNQPGIGKSVVYLWNRDSTLNTISEVLDFGTGELKNVEQIEGELIGVTLRTDVNTNLASRMVFRRYNGGTPDIFCEILASTSTGLEILHGQKQNQRLYFPAGITIDGVLHNGIWGVGKDASGTWIVWCDRLPNNETAIAAGALAGFFVIGDFMYISYTDGGYNLTMTSSSSTAYAGSSLLETVINPDIPLKYYTKNKQLKVITVSYDPLTSGQQVILKYKVDGSAWTTVFTETTVGRTTTEQPYDAINTAFTSGREYQYRVETTGGATITEIKARYEILTTLI